MYQQQQQGGRASGQALYMATYQYNAQRPDELSFMPGQVIVGVMKQGPGWFRGYLQGAPQRVGLFPATHVQPQQQSMRQQQMRMPTPNQQPQQMMMAPGVVPMQAQQAAPVAPAPALPPTPAKPPGGGGPPKKSKYEGSALKTRYAVWGSFLAIYGGLIYAVTGGLLLAWSIPGTSPPYRKIWGFLDLVVGGYSAIAGLVIAGYEFRFMCDGHDKPRLWLMKSLALLAGAAPGLLALPTAVGFASVLLASMSYATAFRLGERYPPNPKNKHHGLPTPSEVVTGMRRAILGEDVASRNGRLFFLVLYVGATNAVGLANMFDSLQGIERTGVNDRFTLWVPVAKFFGGVMNVNFTVLFIPVSRTFITKLYSESSKDQTKKAQYLRTILAFFPLDQSLEFHMMCGKVGIFAGVFHTVAHVLNFVYTADLVWRTFGIGIWITGVGLLLMMQCFLTSVQRPVRRGHTELFWYNHYLFVPFVIFCILHGKGMLGPNYWKWIIVPGGTFLVERILRLYEGNMPTTIFGATFMQDKVLCLRISPDAAGPFGSGYKIGQYCFICCPHVSRFEYHPFTISSAPEAPEVTFHIRVQGKNSWTWKVREYLRKMKAGASGKEINKLDLERIDKSGTRLPGKIIGPDGKPLFRIYGPIAAPTQHLVEYQEVVVCASGIGVTPLSSAMASIVLYRWKKFIGKTYPDRANFCWVCSYKDIASFRWFIMLIKHAQDAVFDYANKRKTFGGQGAGRSEKHFSFHVFMTSMPKDNSGIAAELQKEYKESVDNPIAFWGEEYEPVPGGAPFTPFQLYSTMKNPQQDVTTIGHNVFVHKGRPKWDKIFTEISSMSPEKDIAVTFCGNPLVGKDLSAMCEKYTSRPNKVFHLHKEVF